MDSAWPCLPLAGHGPEPAPEAPETGHTKGLAARLEER